MATSTNVQDYHKIMYRYSKKNNTNRVIPIDTHLHSPVTKIVMTFPSESTSPETPNQQTPNQSTPNNNNDAIILMMTAFGCIFIIIIIASICMFFLCNRVTLNQRESNQITKKKQHESNKSINYNLSRTRYKSFNSPSMFGATDYVSSVHSYHVDQFGSSQHEYVIETTESITSPTKRWLLTDLLGKGRFGFVHLCVDLEKKPMINLTVTKQENAMKEIIISVNEGRNNRSSIKSLTKFPSSHLDVDNVQLFAVKRAMFEIGENGENIPTKECNSIYQEMKILVDLKHENIVKFYGSAVCDRSILFFMEYCSIGNLSTILKQFGPLDLVTTHKFTKNLLSAIQYLHSMKIVHRDIKGRNILISSTMDVKLADFGSSIIVSDIKKTEKSVGGTIHWMPPEVFQRKYSSPTDLYKHDIWSLGITIIEMLTTQPLFAKMKPIQYAEMLKHDIDKFKITEMDNKFVNNLINKCLIIDYTKRPNAMELIENDEFIVLNLVDQSLSFEFQEEIQASVNFENIIKTKHKETINRIHKIIQSHDRYFGQQAIEITADTESISKMSFDDQ